MRPAGLLLPLLVGCGDPPARVQLVPVSLPGDCGKSASKTALRVIAYTPGGELRRSVPPDEIDAFPDDTEQLGVEVVGDSGALIAIGKTAPLAFAALEDGSEIPIVMAPPDGFCPAGSLTEPRVAPLVARAGDGVLVAGGVGPGGEQLSTAEYFDPATATFSPVAMPSSLVDADNGLAGAVLTELPDGSVVLTGTASHAFARFDPATRTWSTPSLFDRRAFHGAVALDDEHLLVIGGCEDVSAGACTGEPVRSAFRYDVTDLAQRESGPVLGDSATRLGARVFDLGVQRDGPRRYLLAGGFGDPGAADRFAATDAASEPVGGLGAQLAALDGGAVLTAFAPDGTAQTGTASVLPPGGGPAVPIAIGPRLDGARLVALEDGTVLAFGGDPEGELARYLPTTNTWSTITPGGDAPVLEAPVTVRLADGAVLVLGDRGARADAWIFRPSLVGPRTGSIVAVPDASTEGVLSVPDPSTVSRAGGDFRLTASDDELRARALVGGPRMADGSITAIVRVGAGGVALLAQEDGPGEAIVGRLVPGEPARIEHHSAGTIDLLCTGMAVDAAELAAPIGLAIRAGTATLTIGGAGASTVKASCAVTSSRRGAWGVAAATSGSQIDLGPVTVARTR